MALPARPRPRGAEPGPEQAQAEAQGCGLGAAGPEHSAGHGPRSASRPPLPMPPCPTRYAAPPAGATTSSLDLALPAPSPPKRHGQPPALARLSFVLSATAPNTDTGEVPLTPPLLKCLVGTRHQKFRLWRFFPQRKPVLKMPPCLPDSQKFYKQKSGLCRGLRWPGAVASSASWRIGPGLAEPWPRRKATHALTVGAPFASRGGAVSGPVRRRLIFPGGGLRVHFGVPVLPPGRSYPPHRCR